jgi:hypothetical protein
VVSTTLMEQMVGEQTRATPKVDGQKISRLNIVKLDGNKCGTRARKLGGSFFRRVEYSHRRFSQARENQ